MIGSAPAILAGMGAGVGVVVAAAGLSRPRADLGDLLQRMDARRLENLQPHRAAGPTGALDRLGARLVEQLGEGIVRVPRRDLDLVGRTPAQHVGKKTGFALVGLLMPGLLLAVLALAGASLPIALPALAGLALAAVLWIAPDVNLREEAAKARTDFRHAIASYLELVCLERAADAGPSEALHKAAAVGDGWVFVRLRDTLARADLAGMPPWEGLKQLAEELGVPELAAPADIIATAGDQGAAVIDTLRAQAESLRGVLLTDEQAKANTVSEKMIIPVSVLVIIMAVYAAYPAIARIMAS